MLIFQLNVFNDLDYVVFHIKSAFHVIVLKQRKIYILN